MGRRVDGLNQPGQRAFVARLENRERGNDGDEDAGKKVSHLQNRRPGKLVAGADFAPGRCKRQKAHADENRVLGEIFHCLMDAENGNLAHFGGSAHQHRADNAGKKNEIAFALNAQRLRRIVRHGGFAFLSVIVSIEYKIKRQEDNACKGHFRQDMQRPEKRNPVQKAQKQGRVPQRRERPADVAHQKNEKNDGVHFMDAPGVGAQDRADEQHGGAGGPDDGGQKCADEQNDGIDGGRSFQRTADVNAA